MSIASELTALNGYILGAYDEINTKGGTVPANKNMANLASAIGSISTGSSTTITPLSVTENGTYTAPTGTAYSPVTVNVSGGGASDNNWTEVMRGESTALYDNAASSLRSYALYGRSDLTSVSIPLVSAIPGYCFYNCSNLANATFSNISSLGSYCFYNCSKLTSLNFGNITSIPSYSFCHSGIAGDIDLPSVTTIGTYAFNGCTSLTSVKLTGLSEFNSTSALSGCTKLKKIDIKTSVASTAYFSSTIVQGCTSLEALVLRTTKVMSATNANTLKNTGIRAGAGYIYVPSVLVGQYKSTGIWATYASQIRAIEDYSDDGTVDGDINV